MKKLSKISLLFFVSIFVSLIFGVSGCVSSEKAYQVAHENFINIMNHRIGTSFIKFKNRKGYIGAKELNDGIEEHEFIVITDRCHVFFQVDSKDIIVDWRFEAENSKLDCYINP